MHMIVWFVVFTSLIGSIGTMYVEPDGHYYSVVDADQRVMHEISITPMVEYSNRHIVMQQFDYSCGSAALATLLNYHLGEQFTEMQVIEGLMSYGNLERIRQRRAFSFLDMKRFVDALGYHGAGYQAEMENLLELDVPVLLPIEINGYQHFVVFRGIYDNRVFLADPWLGKISYPVKAFEDIWYRKVIFMAEPRNRPARNLLALTPEDMRYTDEDMVLWTLFPSVSIHPESRPDMEALRHLDIDAHVYQR